MFNENEKQLIQQAERCVAAETVDSATVAMIKQRLRNIIEKYKELNKRERFHNDKDKYSSSLSSQSYAEKIERLTTVLEKMN